MKRRVSTEVLERVELKCSEQTQVPALLFHCGAATVAKNIIKARHEDLRKSEALQKHVTCFHIFCNVQKNCLLDKFRQFK